MSVISVEVVVRSRCSMNRVSRALLLALASFSLVAVVPIISTDKSSVYAQSRQCNVTFLSNTLRGRSSFTDGRSVITLVRQARVSGAPTFDVIFNNQLIGRGRTPFVLINNLFSVRFRSRTRTNPFTGRVELEQAAAATTCFPWRRF